MKKQTLSKIAAFCLAVLGGDISIVQAAELPLEDASDLFVWIFLAFCALIILAQLIPAMLVLLGFAKGLKKESKPAVTEVIEEKTAEKHDAEAL